MHVTSAVNGKIVTAVVTVSIPASAGTGRSGRELNGQVLRQGAIRWSLTQA